MWDSELKEFRSLVKNMTFPSLKKVQTSSWSQKGRGWTRRRASVCSNSSPNSPYNLIWREPEPPEKTSMDRGGLFLRFSQRRIHKQEKNIFCYFSESGRSWLAQKQPKKSDFLYFHLASALSQNKIELSIWKFESDSEISKSSPSPGFGLLASLPVGG